MAPTTANTKNLELRKEITKKTNFMIALVLSLLFIGASTSWMAWHLANASEGYEDRKGFHFGKKDKKS